MVVDDTPRRVRRMFWTLELLMRLKCSVAFHQSPISKMVEGFNCTTFTTIKFKLAVFVVYLLYPQIIVFCFAIIVL